MLGLETEYALVFTPEVGSPAPVQEKIFEALSEVLRREYLCLEAAYRKGGFFLANGGLVHYEETGATHHGLLEMATPECATVRDAVAHHRAQERVVLGALAAVEAKLRDGAYAGRLVVGKHSSDYEGHTFGTHENYLVEDVLGAREKALALVAILIYSVLHLPLTVARLCVRLFAIAAQTVQFGNGIATLMWRAIKRVEAVPAEPPALIRWTQRAIELAADALFRIKYADENWYLPLWSAMASRIVLERYRRFLVPFLITRLVFTGTGWLRTDRPREGARFTLSPKAASIGAVIGVNDPACKPILDIKNLFGDPLALLSRRKRLHVSYSDTNMSEYALWLKLGTTELVVRMLEAGFTPERVELAEPLAALSVVNADLSLAKTLSLDGAEGWSALEIQARYLACAKRYVEIHRPEDADARALLEAWKEMLETLDDDPMSLGDRLDWIAKKDLMDEAQEDAGLPGDHGWDLVARALPAIRYLEDHNVGLGRAIDRPEEVRRWITARLGPADAPGLEEAMRGGALRWEQLPDLYRLFYQLKKLDLRYHELGQDGGYFQQMEGAGMFRGVLNAGEVEHAMQWAPRGTRGFARGHYIREAARLGMDALIGWERIFVPARFTVIELKDPESEVPPVDLAGLTNQGFLWSVARALVYLPHMVSPY